MNVSVIIPSAGSGNRFGQLKQFKKLNGEPLVILTIKPFLEIQEIVEIIIVVPSNDIFLLNQYLKTKPYKEKIKLVKGIHVTIIVIDMLISISWILPSS